MKILLVDDDRKFLNAIVSVLEFEHFETRVAENGLSARRMLDEEAFAAVVTDLNMPGSDGLELLRWIQEEGPALPVMMMSGYGGISDAVEAMKLGAQDYIVKPFDPEVLIVRLRRIIENQELKHLVEAGKQYDGHAFEFIGASPEIEAIKRLIHKIAPTPATVLISGESGTGKEVVARAIHQHSPRAAKPFMAINIGGIPENLLESELFGYEKGAFTGATTRKIGLCELASSGTLFLDEIGDMPLHLQNKLLRVLQERKIQRLGGTRNIPIDVRIVTATNRRLEDLIAEGTFREDMFYRLNVIRIDVPPLRERPDDIPLLAGHFIKKFNRMMGKSIRGIHPKALKTLQHYDFPGNVRELENLIERAVILTEDATITVKDLGLTPRTPVYRISKGTLAEVQRQAIHTALIRWEGNRTRAAKELGITRKTLLSRIKEYGFENLA